MTEDSKKLVEGISRVLDGRRRTSPNARLTDLLNGRAPRPLSRSDLRQLRALADPVTAEVEDIARVMDGRAPRGMR